MTTRGRNGINKTRRAIANCRRATGRGFADIQPPTLSHRRGNEHVCPRKSFLASAAIPETGAEQAAPDGPARSDASMVAEALAVMGGAHILRTHEPARAAIAARLAEAVVARSLAAPD